MREGNKYNTKKRRRSNNTHDIRSKLSEEAYYKLEYLADFEGVSVSQMIRILIMHEMNHNQKYKTILEDME